MDMIMTPESSNIICFGHDASTSVLTVEFKRGVRYNYLGVGHHQFEAMKAAESKGKFLNTFIKPNYSFERVSE